jgi:hypothetical protein
VFEYYNFLIIPINTVSHNVQKITNQSQLLGELLENAVRLVETLQMGSQIVGTAIVAGPIAMKAGDAANPI